MIATSTDCLSVEELNRLLDGHLSSEEFDSASKHVDQCEQCQSRIPEKWEALSSIANADSEQDSVLAESACQFAVGQLMTANAPVPYAAADLPIDQIGPYEILGQLGQGGMGMVCLARHNRLKRQCAIKLLPPHRVMEPGWLDRFDREMTTVASLEHPGIVRATDAGTHSGWHYLVMEYLEGMDVGKIAHRLGSLPVADACEIARQSAVALMYVHETGLIHRDVKPSNLMLTRDGTVKLLDLGLVLAGDDPLATDDRLTTVGHLMGTLPAMSPEQLIDSRKVQPASDIYSLGATLYRLISGRWPHANEGGLAARVLAITSESNRSSPLPLSNLEPSVKSELETFVGQMMHRQPDQRPSGSVVAERLAIWSGDANLTALLKRAESTPVSDAPITPSLPLATKPASPPPGNGKHTWTAWLGPLGWFAAAVLLATVVVQIKTDKGLVTVTTDGKETKVAEDENSLPTEAISSKDSRTDPSNTDLAIVYEGKNLDAWFETLASEKEMGAIGRAMRAVERLSRDTTRRAEAAKATLDLTDEYGTWHVAPPVVHNEFMGGGFGGTPPIDQQFMSHLQKSYPHYFPMPGLQTIGPKLTHGNQKARIASILQLRNFVMNLNHDTGSTHRPMSVEVFLASKRKTSEGRAYIETLLQQIGSASAGLKPLASEKTDTSTPIPNSLAGEANSARETAWAIAVRIIGESGPHISPPDWIADYVEEQVDEAVAKYEQREIDPETGQTKWDYTDPNAEFRGMGFGGMGGGPQMITTPTPPKWLLSSELFLPAVEMRREGRLEFSIPFAVETLAHPRFNWYPSYGSSLNDLVQTLTAIDPKAPSLIAFHLDRSFQEMDRQYQASQNAEWLRPLTFLRQRLEEGLATVYTTHVDHPQKAHERLMRLCIPLFDLSPFGKTTKQDRAVWGSITNGLAERFESE